MFCVDRAFKKDLSKRELSGKVKLDTIPDTIPSKDLDLYFSVSCPSCYQLFQKLSVKCYLHTRREYLFSVIWPWFFTLGLCRLSCQWFPITLIIASHMRCRYNNLSCQGAMLSRVF